MAKLRNYAQEYARRIANGLSQGLTRNQARGHPSPGEVLKSVKAPVVRYDRQLEEAVKRVRGGKSLNRAAKSVQVSAERVRTYLTSQGIGAKVGNRWTVGKDNRVRELPVYTQGEARTIEVRGYQASKRIGEYMAAVSRFLDTNDPSFLQPFVGKSVRDNRGESHVFETDPNTLYRLATAGGDDFSRIYRIQL